MPLDSAARRLQETKAVLRDATESLTHELGRAPTVNELAAKLAVSSELVLEAMTADDAFSPTSLDAAVGNARLAAAQLHSADAASADGLGGLTSAGQR